MKLLKTLDNWLYLAYGFVEGKILGAYRIFFCLYLLAFGVVDFEKIGNYSPHLYKPKSSLAIWFELPSSEFFIFLDYFILLLIVLVLFGFKTRWMSILLGSSLIVGQSFLFSFGKIDHGFLLVSFLPIVMSFSNWGSCFSIDSKKEAGKIKTWPISLMSLILGFAMFTAGLQKLFGGWLNPEFQAIRSHIFRSFINLREGVLTEFMLGIKSKILWESMDILIVGFELGFLLVVFNRKWFRKWIALAILFHIGVILSMDITFSQNVIVYLLFLDWIFIMDNLRFERILKILQPFFSVYVMIAVGALLLAAKYFYDFMSLRQILHLSKMTSSFILFGTGGLVIIGSYLKNWRRLDLGNNL